MEMLPRNSASRYLLSVLLLTGFLLPGADCLAAKHNSTMPDLHWRMIGPFRGGRTRAAAGVPDQPNAFYPGQVEGGVKKPTD